MSETSEIKSVTLQRIKDLREVHPDAEVEGQLLDGRAMISVIKDHRTIECDFVESPSTCDIPRRLDEYYEILGRDIFLGVIVPKKSLAGERKRMSRVKDGSRFVVLGYDSGAMETI